MFGVKKLEAKFDMLEARFDMLQKEFDALAGSFIALRAFSVSNEKMDEIIANLDTKFTALLCKAGNQISEDITNLESRYMLNLPQPKAKQGRPKKEVKTVTKGKKKK
jgi:hypothetical protein